MTMTSIARADIRECGRLALRGIDRRGNTAGRQKFTNHRNKPIKQLRRAESVATRDPHLALDRHTFPLSASNPCGHCDAIRKQHNSSMFYLPKNDKLGEDAIATLDRINNCDAQAVDFDELITKRLFTLSDYGFYLFLFKLSLHLTRIREGVSRN